MIETKLLNICIGVPIAPGHSNSSESGVDVLPLLLPDSEEGFTLPRRAWNPKIANLRDGGQWREGEIPGTRILSTDDVGNVREDLTLQLRTATKLSFWQHRKILGLFAQRAREFWALEISPDPVYLE